jgi:hypothetical protein
MYEYIVCTKEMGNVSKSGRCVEWDTVDGEDIVLKA